MRASKMTLPQHRGIIASGWMKQPIGRWDHTWHTERYQLHVLSIVVPNLRLSVWLLFADRFVPQCIFAMHQTCTCNSVIVNLETKSLLLCAFDYRADECQVMEAHRNFEGVCDDVDTDTFGFMLTTRWSFSATNILQKHTTHVWH